MEVAILLKRGVLVQGGLLEDFVSKLRRRNCSVRMVDDSEFHLDGVRRVPEKHFARDTDLLAVFGGDGTLLHGIKLLDGNDIPILGVNLGTLGFLTEIQRVELDETLEAFMEGRHEESRRRMLTATLLRDDKEVVTRNVLNDAVINKSVLARIIRLKAYADGRFITSYRGDGLIVSTPTGSTAYNMSAGGPVLYPTLESIVMTPICPHTFANRPLVLPDDTDLLIELEEANGAVHLTLDGQEGTEMLEGDRLLIHRARRTVRLIRPPKHDYFHILRHKLGWGQD